MPAGLWRRAACREQSSSRGAAGCLGGRLQPPEGQTGSSNRVQPARRTGPLQAAAAFRRPWAFGSAITGLFLMVSTVAAGRCAADRRRRRAATRSPAQVPPEAWPPPLVPAPASPSLNFFMSPPLGARSDQGQWICARRRLAGRAGQGRAWWPVASSGASVASVASEVRRRQAETTLPAVHSAPKMASGCIAHDTGRQGSPAASGAARIDHLIDAAPAPHAVGCTASLAGHRRRALRGANLPPPPHCSPSSPPAARIPIASRPLSLLDCKCRRP